MLNANVGVESDYIDWHFDGFLIGAIPRWNTRLQFRRIISALPR